MPLALSMIFISASMPSSMYVKARFCRPPQHRPRRRRQLGGAPQHRLHELHRSEPEARGVRAHRRRGRAREPQSPRGRRAGGRPDPEVPDPAQGAGSRRRGDHAHPQGAPRPHRPQVRAAHRGALRRSRPRGRRGAGDVRGRSGRHHPCGRPHPGRAMSTSTEAAPLLSVDGVSVRFGALLALSRVSLDIRAGEILAIIGPNGAGKTTLLNVISGFYHPYEGRIAFAGRDRTRLAPPDVAELGVARTFQNVALFKGMSVLDNIMTGRLLKMRGSFLYDAVWWGPAR